MTTTLCNHPGCPRSRPPDRDYCAIHRVLHRQLTRREKVALAGESTRLPRHARTLPHSLCTAYTELTAVLAALGSKPPYRAVDAELRRKLDKTHDALRDALLLCKRTK